MELDQLISDYRLLSETSSTRLSKAVDKEIQAGWQPYGAPFSSPQDKSPSLLLQAMVRRGASGAWIRDLRLEGVRALQTRLLDVTRDKSVGSVELLRIVLQLESDINEEWEALNQVFAKKKEEQK